jgi:hypothetical protein
VAPVESFEAVWLVGCLEVLAAALSACLVPVLLEAAVSLAGAACQKSLYGVIDWMA